MNIKRYAKIKDGVVENLVMVNVDNLSEIAGYQLVSPGPGAERGSTYSDENILRRRKMMRTGLI
jgi:hypothetical protein